MTVELAQTVELTPARCGDTETANGVGHQSSWSPRLDLVDRDRGDCVFGL